MPAAGAGTTPPMPRGCWLSRDKARALADSYANGEVITKGIARLVDEQCARAYAARDEARAASAMLPRAAGGVSQGGGARAELRVHEHGPCEWDAACDAIARAGWLGLPGDEVRHRR